MVKPKTKRLGREERKNFLIQATFECIVEGGLHGVTIREVAARAGVTLGLIRHYFPNKNELIKETYRKITADMTHSARQTALDAGPTAKEKLAAFIRGSLSNPLTSKEYLAFWSSYVVHILNDEEMREVHRVGFAEYRSELRSLIEGSFAEVGNALDSNEVDDYVIKVNAIIDGTWIEACLIADGNRSADFIRYGLEAVEEILSIKLH